MRRRSLRGLVAVFSLLSMPLLAGCEVRTLQIELPGFASGEVDGIWLWKQSAGQWRRVCRIDFENHRITARGEEISYVGATALEKLLLRDGWEIPIVDFADGALVRISAHLYNHADEADALAAKLRSLGVSGR